MTRKALGRGLSALLADSLAQGDELLEIDIDLIEPNPDQPRYVAFPTDDIKLWQANVAGERRKKPDYIK